MNLFYHPTQAHLDILKDRRRGAIQKQQGRITSYHECGNVIPQRRTTSYDTSSLYISRQAGSCHLPGSGMQAGRLCMALMNDCGWFCPQRCKRCQSRLSLSLGQGSMKKDLACLLLLLFTFLLHPPDESNPLYFLLLDSQIEKSHICICESGLSGLNGRPV